MRRRLFDPTPEGNARIRDGVIRAFSEMYHDQARVFPSGVGEAEYRRRMELSYPIHSELFDRLFGDWSALDKFQRTRGVLRLMAIAISQLWQRGDQSLLIMPGNLPMDSGALVSEMKKYLEEGWDPVIKSDVDGENALPLRIDKDNKHFGRISACRRAARTVYMGSAPYADEGRGVDIKRVVLGSVQPGEPTGQFADALKRLSDEATHLYVDGAQYRFSLQPNATRLAADRAASNYTDHDADDEVRARLAAQRGRGAFTTVQVFAAGPGDVPDEDDGVRLVILTPEVTHDRNSSDSDAVSLAASILNQRDAGPRLNRNLLVFVAAAANRLADLRAASRLYLAWQSILDESDALNLTPANQKLARTQITKVSQQVDALIAETFTMALTPAQEPGTAEITWATTKVGTTGDIGDRVSKKLATEEKLIGVYGGVRVKMDIDRYALWSERGDLAVGDLWNGYARYPHMPRLASFDVLRGAISDGTSSLDWAAETFAYAEAWDGDTWVGIHTGEHVTPVVSGLLVEPSAVPKPAAGDGSGDGGADGSGGGHGGVNGAGSGRDGTAGSGEAGSGRGSRAGAGATLAGGAAGAGTPGTAGSPGDAPAGASGAGTGKTQFYAQFTLDSVRAIKQLSEILEHVTQRLGPDIQLDLEIRATNPDGYDDATVRIVSENATNLNAHSTEFE